MTFAAAWPVAPATAGCLQTGSPMHWPATLHRCNSQHGFTYLWLLLILAAGAAGMAALGHLTSAAVHRDREAELMFRGHEIARAISAFQAATPGDVKALPASLQDLLDDRRSPKPAHHLRRLYLDPFTGKADWVLITTEDGRIAGVRSRAPVVAMRTIDLPTPKEGERALVSDRIFMVTAPLAASSAASAASAADGSITAPGKPATGAGRAGFGQPDRPVPD